MEHYHELSFRQAGNLSNPKFAYVRDDDDKIYDLFTFPQEQQTRISFQSKTLKMDKLSVDVQKLKEYLKNRLRQVWTGFLRVKSGKVGLCTRKIYLDYI